MRSDSASLGLHCPFCFLLLLQAMRFLEPCRIRITAHGGADAGVWVC